MKKIFHVGHNDKQRKTHDIINGKKVARKEYQLWASMLNRCYCPYSLNENQTYIDCYVDEFFHSYTNFHDWCQNQVGFGLYGYHLDKDLLSSRDKIYSPEKCLFIPKEINLVINRRKRERGLHPIGVSYRADVKNFPYRSMYHKNNKVITIGYFDNELDAHLAYKKAKQEHLVELAAQFENCIDKRAYDALMRYEVNIND